MKMTKYQMDRLFMIKEMSEDIDMEDNTAVDGQRSNDQIVENVKLSENNVGGSIILTEKYSISIAFKNKEIIGKLQTYPQASVSQNHTHDERREFKIPSGRVMNSENNEKEQVMKHPSEQKDNLEFKKRIKFWEKQSQNENSKGLHSRKSQSSQSLQTVEIKSNSSAVSPLPRYFSINYIPPKKNICYAFDKEIESLHKVNFSLRQTLTHHRNILDTQKKKNKMLLCHNRVLYATNCSLKEEISKLCEKFKQEYKLMKTELHKIERNMEIPQKGLTIGEKLDNQYEIIKMEMKELNDAIAEHFQ